MNGCNYLSRWAEDNARRNDPARASEWDKIMARPLGASKEPIDFVFKKPQAEADVVECKTQTAAAVQTKAPHVATQKKAPQAVERSRRSEAMTHSIATQTEDLFSQLSLSNQSKASVKDMVGKHPKQATASSQTGTLPEKPSGLHADFTGMQF